MIFEMILSGVLTREKNTVIIPLTGHMMTVWELSSIISVQGLGDEDGELVAFQLIGSHQGKQNRTER
jgi:hypothetical protein